ncbi:sulfotransferase family protein [Aquibium sp. A9E412]|uniref:sulfotransferase family protein n=1 Tax=Aquibium sp. A9E412 TaxID=2976767 RepID=UPI0025B12A32|nr:sulfotransferase family protein [Aquibium sp. A9E412]MDN2566005.1 sulfotransferase family protein [Aquibium sp. A9E412]
MSAKKLYDILKVSDINWFNAAVNISLNGRYVFVENPKVASSTIKSRLHSNELIGLRNMRVGPHPEITSSPMVKPYQLPVDQLCDILFGPDFYKFTFVRNPFERLLSCYLDKIVGSAPEKTQVDGYWTRTHGAAKENYSFSEFVEAVANTNDNARDKHWRTQCRVTMVGYIDYSFIGRFETLAQHLNQVQRVGRIDFRDVAEVSPHKTGASTKLKEYYTPEIVEKVVDIYEPDFERFKYKRSVD